jgi:hypothetical protein
MRNWIVLMHAGRRFFDDKCLCGLHCIDWILRDEVTGHEVHTVTEFNGIAHQFELDEDV